MKKDFQVAVFENGALTVHKSGNPGHEAVLALPLNRLLVHMVRVPKDADAVETATPILKAMSPFPDEPLTVSCETVSESDEEKVVLAAAFPEGSSDQIAELLDAEKLSVTRIDLLAIGELRGVWSRFDASDGRRRLIRISSPDCRSLIILDGDMPVALRGLNPDAEDVAREEMLLQLEAESFAGPKPLVETIDVESSPNAVDGIIERTEDPSTLNALPESWREVLDETRFKAKLIKHVIAAVAVWVLVMSVLFGVPVAYGFMTDHQKSLSKQHQRQYKLVSDKKKKVEVFRQYSDHARGALEIMKAVSDRLPEGVTLSSWNYDRTDGLQISGDADTDSEVYDFKNKMVDMAFGEGDDAQKVFETVELGALNMSHGKQRFTMTLGFTAEEDGE